MSKISLLLQEQNFQSSLGFKYPPSRNNPLNIGDLWLDDKRQTDGAEGFWRIHDKLYDFTSFIDKHPGGEDWLILTKGTDITEAFESHHIKKYAASLLDNYYVSDALQPRNSPFTFEENGFYRTIKKRVREFLPHIPEESMNGSKVYADLLFVSFVTLCFLAGRYKSFVLATFAGISLSMLGNAAHNFFHQKDNFRMHYFNFTLMSSKSWRISHALSHHLFPNTIIDLEVSLMEPFLRYLPERKNVFLKYISWLLSPFVYSFGFISHLFLGVGAVLIYKKPFKFGLLLPALLFTWIIFLNKSLYASFLIFLWMEMVGSFFFFFIGLNAAHHHPHLFHDGDTIRPKHEMDWGIYQVDTTRDRKGFVKNHVPGLLSFGDHTLHHLFPTLDHGKLKYLYPILIETCREFGLEFKLTTQMKLIKGQFLQLIKDAPCTKPRRALRKLMDKNKFD